MKPGIEADTGCTPFMMRDWLGLAKFWQRKNFKHFSHFPIRIMRKAYAQSSNYVNESGYIIFLYLQSLQYTLQKEMKITTESLSNCKIKKRTKKSFCNLRHPITPSSKSFLCLSSTNCKQRNLILRLLFFVFSVIKIL